MKEIVAFWIQSRGIAKKAKRRGRKAKVGALAMCPLKHHNPRNSSFPTGKWAVVGIPRIYPDQFPIGPQAGRGPVACDEG
ncbi:hypothetical protein [Persicobacter diffluens]|uniref:hypothetical protein n=1 Tax=Persicobacter diffluens TaxID=981 RepID=UPI0030C6CA14